MLICSEDTFIIVCLVYMLDWAQTCSATYDTFHWFVWEWGNLPDLYNLYSTFLNVPILSSIIAAIVQIFFGWRIWKFSESRIVFGVVILLALVQLGGAIAVGVFLWQDASEVTRSDGLVRAVGVRLAGSGFVDTVIAISMTYFLLRSKSQAMGHMNNVVTRLIRLTIETGTVTAIAAIVDLIFFLKEHNGLHQVSGVILCKLYSNTLLVLYNNRIIMASKDDDNVHFPSDGSRSLEPFRPARRGPVVVSSMPTGKGNWTKSEIESVALTELAHKDHNMAEP
ncbi:hypothetical protein D9757_008990 [Collybiopsis confluens]|uniref:DUF6534 domain-containing protein n=1 Tax=Collybiopsis confluens TaxID=2823264 RepID=A0A8H5H369_9AGAR|nr:hypothetical protein D9757_008990 [Collybiopsis confluens]